MAWGQGRLLHRPGTVDREFLSQRADLAIANKDVAKINSKLTTRIPGELTAYWSGDWAVSEEDEDLFPTEYFDAFYEASLPPHELFVKPGVPICIGTRLRLRDHGRHA